MGLLLKKLFISSSSGGYVIIPFVIASERRERGNLLYPITYEIASVVLLLRNDVVTQPPGERGQGRAGKSFHGQ